MAVGTLVVKIAGDISDLSRNLDAAEKRLLKAGEKLEKVGSNLSLKVTAPLVALSAAFAKSAAEDAASVDKLGRAFGTASGKMESFIQQLMKSVPATDDQLRTLAVSTDTLLTSMGLAPQKAMAMSQTVLKLAGDLAAYNHVSLETATDAVEKALAGRTKGLVALNVVVTEADVKAKAYQMGLAKVGGELSATAKAQATLAAIIDKSAKQQGEAARTYGDADNALARLKQAADGVADSFGAVVLPVFVKVADAASAMARKLAELEPSTKTAIVATLALAAAWGPLLYLGGNLVKMLTLARAAFLGLASMQALSGIVSLAAGVRSVSDAMVVARLAAAGLATALMPVVAIAAPIAAVGYLWYKSGEAAREAAKKVDEFTASLALMNKEQVKTATLGLQAQFDDVTAKLTAARAKLPKAAPVQIGFGDAKVGNPAATAASSQLHDQIRDLEAQQRGIAQMMFDAGSRFNALTAPAGTGGGGGGGFTDPAKAIDDLTDRAGRLARTYELTNAQGKPLVGLNAAVTDTMQSLSGALAAQTDQWSELALKIRQARAELSKAAGAGDATLIQQTQATGAPGLNLGASNIGRGFGMPLAIGKMSEPLVKQVTLQERMVNELSTLPAQFASTLGQYLGPVLARMGGGTGGAIGAALGGGIGGAIGKAFVPEGLGKIAGAVVGSALPVVGTIIGSIAGNWIGGTIGKLFGGGGPSPAEKAAEQLQRLAQAAQKVQEAISGLPEGIKIAAYRYDATTVDAGPGDKGGTGGPTTSGPLAPAAGAPQISIGNLVLQGVQDVPGLFRAISDYAESQIGRSGTSGLQLAVDH